MVKLVTEIKNLKDYVFVAPMDMFHHTADVTRAYETYQEAFDAAEAWLVEKDPDIEEFAEDYVVAFERG